MQKDVEKDILNTVHINGHFASIILFRLRQIQSQNTFQFNDCTKAFNECTRIYIRLYAEFCSGDLMLRGKTYVVILLCLIVTMLPLATIADEGDPDDAVGSSTYGYDMWWPQLGHFDYSEGKAIGTYLKFDVDESTGVVTDYTVTMFLFNTFYPMVVYEEEYSVDDDGEIYYKGGYPEYDLTYENITVFESIETQGFVANGKPGTYSDIFVFQGEEAVMIFYDREYSQGYYASSDCNTTVIFEVAEGFQISTYQDYWYDNWYEEWEDGEYEGEKETGDGVREPEYPEEKYYWTFWTDIWIEYNNTITNLMIYNGNASIENQTITVDLNLNGYIQISSWVEIPYYPIFDDIWYDGMENEYEMELIEKGREQGIIAGEGWFYKGDYQESGMKNSDYTFFNDPTFKMEFNDLGNNLIDIEVDSKNPEGRVVMINLNKKALEVGSLDDLLVKLDGNVIKSTKSLDELMDEVGGSKAKYYAMFGDEGTTVFVYVPHFSTHTITIESVLSVTSNILVPGILAIVLVAAAASVLYLRGRKAKDEF